MSTLLEASDREPLDVALALACDLLPERIISKIEVNEHGCWIFGHGVGLVRGGYAHIWWRGRYVVATRVVWEIVVGSPVPANLDLDHWKINLGLPCSAACVRPDHVEPVTRLEHNHRGNNIAARNVAKTACPRGHPYSHVRDGRRRCRPCHREEQHRYRGRLVHTN